MPTRRVGRERALAALYSIEVGRREASEVLAEVVGEADDAAHRTFVRELVLGTRDFADRADLILGPLLEGWAIERLPTIDRLLLEMAAYELCRNPQTPPAVAINEAVELAKRYSTEDSGRFVNGVLSAVARTRSAHRDADVAE
jgi:N utilization substance protein B